MNVPPADYTRTLAALTAIPALVETLELELIDATATTEGARTKPSSRPPANPELISDLEQAWGILTTWAKDWAETYTFTAPPPYWDDVCGFLARHWPNTANTHPAAQEFADEIAGTESRETKRTETGPLTTASVWVRLSRHTLDEPREWQPILGRWHCPVIHPDTTGNCDGALMENMLQRVITCNRCSTTWTYDQYDKLGAMLGMEYTLTVEQASLVAKVSKRTIDRWIRTEQLPSTADERGRRMVDRRDLYALTTRRVTNA